MKIRRVTKKDMEHYPARFGAAYLMLLLGAAAFGQSGHSTNQHKSESVLPKPVERRIVPKPADGPVRFPQINNRFYVDGVTYPNTQAGVQSAVKNTCKLDAGAGPNTGGNTLLPPSVINVTAQAGQLFLSNCPLEIGGSTGEATIFNVAAGIASSVAVFRLKALAPLAQIGYHIHHFTVQSANGLPTAGDVLAFDNNSGWLPGPSSVEVDHIVTNQGAVNGYDINTAGLTTVAPGQNNWYIHDNLLQNGLRLDAQTGDAEFIAHNLLHSRSGSGHPCFDLTSQAGASHVVFAFNDADMCDAGDVFIHFAIQPKILFNQFEASNSCTGPNSAMLDLQGDIGTIDGAEIAGNNLNAHATCLKNIRLNNSTNAHIVGNRIIANPAGGTGIDLAGATGVAIGPNPGTFGGTSQFVFGDTPARKVRYYANVNAGAPDTRAISPSDLDNAVVARRNSAAQSAALFRCEDETGAGICSITPAGQFISNSPGGSGSNASFEAVGSALPSFDLNNTSAGPDQKVWDMAATPTSLQFRTINDSNNNALPITVINRNGLTPTSIINAPFVQNSFNSIGIDADFVTANRTGFQNTGLSWALPPEARKYNFHCSGAYSQRNAKATVAFGIQASSEPNNIFATGTIYTASQTSTTGGLAALTTTKAGSIVAATPGATGTNFKFEIDGRIDVPAIANTISVMVSTASGSDVVTVLRGSSCNLY